jgi:hypothetical protein
LIVHQTLVFLFCLLNVTYQHTSAPYF